MDSNEMLNTRSLRNSYDNDSEDDQDINVDEETVKTTIKEIESEDKFK